MIENQMMNMVDDDEDELTPVDNITGDRVPNPLIAEKILRERTPAQTQHSSDESYSPKDMAALQYAHDQSQTAQMGRALNAIAAGSGYKPDNSGFAQIEKEGETAAQNQLKRSEAVKKAIADRQLKMDLADQKNQTALRGQDIRSQLAKTLQSNKDDQRHDKMFTDAANALEQMRGNPAVQQAEKDVYASRKAKSMLDAFGGDPDKLPPAMVNLLVSEVGKIAQGGVPSMHELEGLTPSTIRGALAKQWEKLSNDPTAANAGDFIKNYMKYADSVTKDAQATIKDRYGRILDSREHLLRPEEVDILKNKYINRFDDAQNSTNRSGPVKMQFPDGSIKLVPADQVKEMSKYGKAL